MTPQEAQAAYEAEWPVLNEHKEEAIAKDDHKAAKKARQTLSALSDKYYCRHNKDKIGILQLRIEFLEQRLVKLECYLASYLNYDPLS